MKFKLLSDLHLEFDRGNPWFPQPTADDKDTTLLLAGDIHVGKNAEMWIDEMCDRFHKVIYILGNHEYYGHEYYAIQSFWRDKDQSGNFVFLENDHTYVRGDVAIFGATLWTFVQIRDPFMARRMNDYRIIKINDYGIIRTLTVDDTNEIHQNTIYKLKKFLDLQIDAQKIVMTHHLPHPICVHPRYVGDSLNAFFVTDLDDILKQYDIAVWVHGHTHDNVDTEVHGTRILCNPRGYSGVQLNNNFNQGLTFCV
jgi:predicted phosphodiesterase